MFSFSFEVNRQNTGSEIWFHNDWLSVFYSYGLLGVLGLVAAYFSLYAWLKSSISDRFYVSLIFLMLLFLSFVNGLYYYYPLVFLYLICCFSVLWKSRWDEKYGG